MARRRRRNPLPLALNPINKGDWTPILVGAVGGGLAMYLYLKNMATTPAPAGNTVAITTTPATPPTA